MENIRKYQTVDNSNKTFTSKVVFKGTLIVILLTCIFLNCIYGFGLPSNDVKCIEDASHKYTEKINSYLQDQLAITNAITIISSLCIDIIMLSICFHWVFRGQSWRFLICLFFFYSLRGFVQELFQMRYPDGFIWNHPGLPSLAVSYLKTNDFFFSGHVGLPIIVACEFFKNKKYYIGYFAIFACCVEFVVMTIMRGHYIIDLIFGIITAHYIFIMVDKYIYILDDSFISFKTKIPIKLIKKTYKDSDESDCKASTSSSDDNGEKFY